MEFKAFSKIERIGKMNMQISQKIHGCVSSDTWITMADGSRKKIKEIVESTEDQYVMGLTCDNKLVETKVLNKWNNGETSDWLTVKVSQSVHRHVVPRNIQVTSNHKFFIKDRGYVRADELKSGDKLVFLRADLKLTYIQEQVLIGKMLGDGSFRKKMVSFSHSVKQKEYFEFTKQCIGYVCGNAQKNQMSGYGSEMLRANTLSLDCIANLFEPWVVDNKKTIPNNLNLTPISLAFWYMDDGSLSSHHLQEDRAAFATNSFSEPDIQILLKQLGKFGIKGVAFKSKGYRIRLNKDDADKLYSLISPYVIPSMQYKLPKRYRGLFNFKVPAQEKQINKPLLEQTVINVSKKQLRTSDKNRYDLETETHNYFADNILVHNSNAQIFIKKNEPYTEPITNSLHLKVNDDLYQIFVGSRNRWITPEDDNYGFASFVYDNAKEFVDKLGVGQYFGEWAGPGINSGEGLTQKTFVLFDFWKFPQERLLPPQTTVVPVLYQGVLDLTQVDAVLNDLKTNGSRLVPGFMRTEGIVVSINGVRYKHVFEAEETQWKNTSGHSKKLKDLRETFDATPYLQPIRLEKLLSRDSRYLEQYPETLPQICKDYIQDLLDEGQIPGNNEDEIKTARKAISQQVYPFVKEMINVN